jgi:hypothetical protein
MDRGDPCIVHRKLASRQSTTREHRDSSSGIQHRGKENRHASEAPPGTQEFLYRIWGKTMMKKCEPRRNGDWEIIEGIVLNYLKIHKRLERFVARSKGRSSG